MSLQSISVALDYVHTSGPRILPLASSYGNPPQGLSSWLSSLLSSAKRTNAEAFRLPVRRQNIDRRYFNLSLAYSRELKRHSLRSIVSRAWNLAFRAREIRYNARDLNFSPGDAEREGRRAHYDRGQTQSAKYAYKRICSRRKTHPPTRRDTRKLKSSRTISRRVHPLYNAGRFAPSTIVGTNFHRIFNFFNLPPAVSGTYNLITCYNYTGTPMTWICNTVDFIWTLAKSASNCNLLMLAHAWS